MKRSSTAQVPASENMERSGNMPQDVSMLYKSVISGRRAMLVLQLTLMAKKSRISAPKLQKALVGICRICEKSQRLVLRPCLIEHIHPCLEEVLDQIHVDHFKKGFCISKQLMLGFRIDIFCQLLFYGCWATSRLLPAHQQPTYTIDFALHLEDSVLRGLKNLFPEYTAILESAITSATANG
ncbi:hypothetical protein POTOM_009142 [Populus tomentosa]|uniref:Uncharacterized protein n=1 Tax=Populus tomentosa TaxID=118781 RepID=A0A8X8AFH2_POPTO|nr:hypothetical protein POTOM_009142 [Populus tomentosa]